MHDDLCVRVGKNAARASALRPAGDTRRSKTEPMQRPIAAAKVSLSFQGNKLPHCLKTRPASSFCLLFFFLQAFADDPVPEH